MFEASKVQPSTIHAGFQPKTVVSVSNLSKSRNPSYSQNSDVIRSSTISAACSTGNAWNRTGNHIIGKDSYHTQDSLHFLHKVTILKEDTEFRESTNHIVVSEHVHENIVHTNASSFIRVELLDQDGVSVKACPFCRRYLLNRTASLFEENFDECTPASSSITSRLRSESEDQSLFSNEIGNFTQEALTKFNKVLVEGWLLKKGSGGDWLGDTKYKPRWARLVLVSLPDDVVDVPVLHMYWYETSTSPSTSIILRDVDVKAIDKDIEKWKNVHCFGIIRSKCQVSSSRTFAASADERNEWVYAINLALAEYSRKRKQKQFDGKASPERNIMRPINLASYDSRWREGYFSA
mmetsp:Transcript_9293/g.12009  ORF Transcript_9293/g.12009 Transcript_9293/m.12009 type:complete len:350 (-) Transcript_9293:739-1788(-)